MTRQEHLDDIDNDVRLGVFSAIGAKNIVHRIYNDIESRTCGNCKHRSKVHEKVCTMPDNFVYDFLDIPSKDFLCNEWTEQDDS